MFDDALDRKRKSYKLLSNQINNTKQKYAVIIRKAGALTRYFIIIIFFSMRSDGSSKLGMVLGWGLIETLNWQKYTNNNENFG